MPGMDSRGFTLIELLLAMSISALVAVIAYAGIGTAIDSSSAMQSQVQRLSDVQRTLDIITEDLLQIRPRPVTNGYGSQEAALVGGVSQDVLLELTRGGFANPLALPRSELQRVRYVIADDVLWRQSWSVLDRADENQAPQSVLLLEHISEISFAFLSATAGASTPPDYYGLANNAGYWENDWNSVQIATDEVSPLPVAIKVAFNVADFGGVERIVELP